MVKFWLGECLMLVMSISMVYWVVLMGLKFSWLKKYYIGVNDS